MPTYKTDPVTGKQLRGFAAMDPEQVRLIAAKGGAGVNPANRSFSRNKDLAAEAGKKGGAAVHKSQRSFARDKAAAAEAGRKGGLAPHANRPHDDPQAASEEVPEVAE